MADSVFVEDIAVVLDELAIVARPGAESRRGETSAVAEALEAYRPLVFIEAPGTLDGGDVLTVGKRLFVGESRRTNAAALAQLGRWLGRHGYSVHGVPVRGCLHLKSAVTLVADDTLLLNPAWVPREPFHGFRQIDVHPAEADGANALLVGERAIYPTAFPRTRGRLAATGLHIVDLDLSELAKAEGAVTCCSVIFTT